MPTVNKKKSPHSVYLHSDSCLFRTIRKR
jgi:hypothetical protein